MLKLLIKHIKKIQSVGLVVVTILLTVCLFGSCSSPSKLKWHKEDGYRWAELSIGYFGHTGFKKRSASETNIFFKNTVSTKNVEENRNFLNGSGVAAADIDGDGLVDIYFAGLEEKNKIYKNMGNFRFKDITEEAGVAHPEYHSTGVTFADVNGDTYPDLLVTCLMKDNALYINDGHGHFTLQKNSGLGRSRGSNTMALADIDNDNDLDLYITNYKRKTARDIFSALQLKKSNTLKKQGDSLIVIPPFDTYYGIIKTDGRSYRNEYGAKDALYLNNGNGRFKKVTDDKEVFLDQYGKPKGLSRDWGLSAKFHDLNGDGYPDLYVANDFWSPDRIWINQGNGTFQAIAKYAIRNMSLASMGVDFSDINKDGNTDMFVTEMLGVSHRQRLRQFSDYLDPIDGRPQYNQNALYLNRGDNTYAEISEYSGISASGWSWATNFLDVDLDGYEDVLITTGDGRDYLDLDTQFALDQKTRQNEPVENPILSYPVLNIQNKIFRNNHDLTFTNKGTDWGFEEKDISNGMTIADLDNDGDADLVMNRFNKEGIVYENKTTADRMVVRLHGNAPNTEGIGAKITLKGEGVDQQKELSMGGSYVSGNQPAAFFAADGDNPDHKINVMWPDGSVSEVNHAKANRIYVIDQSSAISRPGKSTAQKFKKKLFSDVSAHINHQYYEDPYTDRNVQPLLPALLSTQGPGISWIDYDNDEDADLLISSGKGGALSIFENKGNEEFKRKKLSGLTDTAKGDQTTVLGWQEGDHVKLVVGSANFEQGDASAPSAFAYDVSKKAEVQRQIPGILSTTGPLAAADYDNDGDIDLFVGGSFKPGQFPRGATSRLFINEGGNYRQDETNKRVLQNIGLVSSAVFTDYDRDGDQDLLVGRQWDSIVLLENRRGKFIDVSHKMHLDKYNGWWNGIATGDFNNDGRPDIIATNIGSNSVYQPSKNHPLKLFYSDFDMNGTLDIIDSYYSQRLKKYVPRRRLYEFDSMPSLMRTVPSNNKFSKLSVADIFGQGVGTIPSKSINTVQQTVFINKGDHFKAHPLPPEAQFTAAFDPVVADFNNDGNEDLFLSQNFFGFPSDIPRLDAGRGLLLFGNGQGKFKAVSGEESGIKIYGEQRSTAVSDFNKDGKTDLVVSQNEGKTKLYVNNTLKRGVRIRLVGASPNKSAIGSSIRLIYNDSTKSPLLEIQAGSGYRSQNDFTQVLGIHKKPVKIKVNWYDGTKKMVMIIEGENEYRIIKN